jgi:hypothetical protein
MRRDAATAATVSIFPRPIMRVTEDDALIRAMIPTPTTTTATSASTSVKPERPGFMATSECSETVCMCGGTAYRIAAVFIE